MVCVTTVDKLVSLNLSFPQRLDKIARQYGSFPRDKDKQRSTGLIVWFLLESFIQIYDESVNGTRHI